MYIVFDAESIGEGQLSFEEPPANNRCPECGCLMEKVQLETFEGEWVCMNCHGETLK